MGEGGQVLDAGGRISGMRGNCGRPPLPTKFVEQISFQEIEEREVSICIPSSLYYSLPKARVTFLNLK